MQQRDDLFGRQHIDTYRATDGEEGFLWRRGSHILLLTTKGRKSGEERDQALIFREDGEGRYVIVASKGGAPQHPGWYHNLKADPEVQVQVLGDRFTARAPDAEGEERERLWRHRTEVWPDYDRYQQRTDRQIPVVVLEGV